MSTNPIHDCRIKRGLTLEQSSTEAGIHLQAFFLQEQGVYPHLLPAVVQWLRTSCHEEAVGQLETHYIKYQKDKRRAGGEKFGFAIYEMLEPTNEHPFVQFRRELPLSRMGFSKQFCVHPGLLYRVEHGISQSLPDQLTEALSEAGLPLSAIKELNYRIGEL